MGEYVCSLQAGQDGDHHQLGLGYVRLQEDIILEVREEWRPPFLTPGRRRRKGGGGREGGGKDDTVQGVCVCVLLTCTVVSLPSSSVACYEEHWVWHYSQGGTEYCTSL